MAYGQLPEARRGRGPNLREVNAATFHSHSSWGASRTAPRGDAMASSETPRRAPTFVAPSTA
jgi:hypothetical protein